MSYNPYADMEMTGDPDMDMSIQYLQNQPDRQGQIFYGNLGGGFHFGPYRPNERYFDPSNGEALGTWNDDTNSLDWYDGMQEQNQSSYDTKYGLEKPPDGDPNDLENPEDVGQDGLAPEWVTGAMDKFSEMSDKFTQMGSQFGKGTQNLAYAMARKGSRGSSRFGMDREYEPRPSTQGTDLGKRAEDFQVNPVGNVARPGSLF